MNSGLHYLTAGLSERGADKPVNQDAYTIKTAHFGTVPVAFIAVCDGLGGLDRGELASATAVGALARWFDAVAELDQAGDFDRVQREWQDLATRLNQAILRYGQQQGIALGTTAVALLAVGERYLMMNAGDSRAYLLDGGQVRQLSTDHTVVAREAALGRIEPGEMRHHPQRHVLTQCIGASKSIEVSFYEGMLPEDAMLLACSDGFYKELWEPELLAHLAPGTAEAADGIEAALGQLAAIALSRGERDDITVAALRCYRHGARPRPLRDRLRGLRTAGQSADARDGRKSALGEDTVVTHCDEIIRL